ncbi:ATP-binding protein [Streptomyces sp. NPDC051322]|uniref:ATP-binding protein n=1 Tax=Streptomyces sp. NPDC051322 TaxID=3154645 RepID=UPI00344DE06B
MDPISRGPEDYGHADDHYGERDEGRGSARPPRDPLTPDLGQPTAPRARTVRLVAGDFAITVNPVDGSEIEHCPPGEHPAEPQRHSADARADLLRASRPPVPPGPAGPELPLLERDEERERLVRLLARGRSVRLTGAPGSGRTALLDAVARDCADLAPDGVIRLSGYHRTAADLLHSLFAAVYAAPLHRPDREELLGLVHRIGAVVVLDDLEFGGVALEELLEATPECAFLIAVAPDVPAPLAESHLDEVFLAGLGRSASLELLERAAERPLTEEEAHWAGDLWFESEGLPLRFVQAAALLRGRDLLRGDTDVLGESGYFAKQPGDTAFPDFSVETRPGEALSSGAGPADGAPSGEGPSADLPETPLPTLGEGAAPAALLAAGLSASARATLAFAVALGGEVPHQAHLPALVGDTHADAALGELAQCGLLSPAGAHYRLAAGVVQQLLAGGYGEEAMTHAQTVAQHYAWWAGHPSVAAERASAEADAVLAAMSALIPGSEPGHPSTAVLLARSAAPAFAAGLQWGAWERALRTGQEAARLSGEVAEEAYFHHELGVLALCTGNTDRARAELEASIALRGALADKHGTVAGRRALALIADRSGSASLGGMVPAVAGDPPATGPDDSTPPSGGALAAGAVVSLRPTPHRENTTLVTQRVPAVGSTLPNKRRTARFGARRDLVAAGAGALLAAVLGTVVTLGVTSNNDPGGNGKQGQSVSEETGDGGLDPQEPSDTSSGGSDRTPGNGAADPSSPGTPGASDGAQPGQSGATPSASASNSPGSGTSSSPGGHQSSPGKPSTGHTPSSTPSSPSPSDPSDSASPPPPPSSTPTETPSSSATDSGSGGSPPGSPTASDTAGTPTTGPASEPASESATDPAGEPASESAGESATDSPTQSSSTPGSADTPDPASPSAP